MKKNFVIGLFAMSMLTLASCSKEQTPGTSAVPDGTPATAKITLSSTVAQSYAPTDPNGRDAEAKIANATLYVFSNKALASIVVFDGAADSKTFQTTTGPKQLFACVNMNGKIPAAVTVGMELDAFKKQIMSVTEIADVATDDSFWMTNLEKDPPISNVEAATNDEVTGSAAKNNFTINVGRACAKVNLDLSATATQNGGELKAIEYKVSNNPKKMYLMPVYDGVNYIGNQLLTPYFSHAWNTPAGANEVDADSYFAGTYKALASAEHFAYMMENSNDPVLKGKATYLMVKGAWNPNADQILNADGSAGGTLTNGTFWRIANYDKVATDPTAKIIGYEAKVYAATPATLTATQKALEYTEGICYYGIWIADNSLTVAALKYTVKRNTYFKVIIDDVAGPGSNTEEGVVPDPTVPVEADVNMKATINVIDWTVKEQHAGLS